ncbi:MAG TPA: LexA family transcriptional regulator [Xanthobacteraceae bacterium]|nr:LexA family transcriptional regulator [Xanthobacteraceae bacterium]
MSNLDPVRATILAESERQGISLAEISKAAGMNHAYIHQFIHRGTPEALSEKVRRVVAKKLKIPEDRLIISDPRVVPLGEEFSEDPDPDRPLTEDERPFPDALPQFVGRMGGGSTGAVVTFDVGDMQAREEVYDWWRVPPAVLRNVAMSESGRTAAFPMNGDSMEPTIQRTDIVFIDTGRQQIEPDGIWAIDYGLGRTLKRVAVKRTEHGIRYVIKSDNERYKDEEYSPEEVTIFGRYVGRFSVF